MIIPTTRKRNPNRSIAMQNLIFERNEYKQYEDLHGKLVNYLYDLQNWHIFYPQELSFKEKVDLFTQWFGKENAIEKLPEKGSTYIWYVKINDDLYNLYLCSYAFFMEVSPKVTVPKACGDLKELGLVIFQGAKKSPKF